jgi:FkbM family methyltransferase
MPAHVTRDFTGVRLALDYEFRKLRTDRDHAFLQRAARGHRLVYDVGANVGLAALLMAPEMEANGRIVCFEPSEDACRFLATHAALNPSRNGVSISVVNALIGERASETVDYFWQSHSGGASIIPGFLDNISRGATKIAKASISLDAYAATRGETPDFLKIDVEGAELSVLRGMRRLLVDARPDIAVEIHGWKGTSLANNAARIVEFLDTVDYAFIYPPTRQTTTDVRPLYANRGRAHALLQPKDREVPAWLGEIDTSNL